MNKIAACHSRNSGDRSIHGSIRFNYRWRNKGTTLGGKWRGEERFTFPRKYIYIYKLIPSVGELEIFSEMEPISNRSSGPITNVPPPPPSVIDFNYVSTSTFGRVTPAYRTEFRITGRKLFPSGKITVGIQETRWKTFIRVCKSSLRRDILSARFAYSFKNIIRRPYPLEGRILF